MHRDQFRLRVYSATTTTTTTTTKSVPSFFFVFSFVGVLLARFVGPPHLRRLPPFFCFVFMAGIFLRCNSCWRRRAALGPLLSCCFSCGTKIKKQNKERPERRQSKRIDGSIALSGPTEAALGGGGGGSVAQSSHRGSQSIHH